MFLGPKGDFDVGIYARSLALESARRALHNHKTTNRKGLDQYDFYLLLFYLRLKYIL